MAYDPEEDARYFGKDAWIYCGQHLAPHLTGWCTVGPEWKVRLHAENAEEAGRQCERLGLKLFKG
jgi:hypothetical protein